MTNQTSGCLSTACCATRATTRVRPAAPRKRSSRSASGARRWCILDVWLQGSKLDGLGILEVLHREEPQVPVVMISGHGTIEMAVAAIQQGAYDFLEKPFQSDRLLLVVQRALEAANLERENAECGCARGQEPELTGDSSVMRHAARRGREGGADRLARADLLKY